MKESPESQEATEAVNIDQDSFAELREYLALRDKAEGYLSAHPSLRALLKKIEIFSVNATY